MPSLHTVEKRERQQQPTVLEAGDAAWLQASSYMAPMLALCSGGRNRSFVCRRRLHRQGGEVDTYATAHAGMGKNDRSSRHVFHAPGS